MSDKSALPSQEVKQTRTAERLVLGVATSDGAGVSLTRVLTQSLQRRLNPYLMLNNTGNTGVRSCNTGKHRGLNTGVRS